MWDERFVMHRYKSTSHAAVVMAVLLGAFFLYEQFAHQTVRWDILIILGAGAVTKAGCLAFFRFRD